MKALRIMAVSGLVAALIACDGAAASGVDVPPASSAPHQTKFAKPQETKLANGVRVIVVERPDLPLLVAELVFRNGAEIDPPERAGVADMTASLLTKGTAQMSAPQIADAIESLGGSIFSGGGWDNSTAGVVVMSDKADRALEIFSDVVLHPTFKREELERLRKQSLDDFRLDIQHPASLASYARVKVVFPSGEYSHPRGGTLETLQAITRDDVLRVYQNVYRPENAILILVGDVNLVQGKSLAEKYFGQWQATGSLVKREPLAETKDWKPRHVVIDMPQAGQAAVVLAMPSIKRASPDYYAGLVGSAALGNGFASRLNQEIRIKRGLSYGAGSSLDARREAGQFIASAQTKNESAAEVARLTQLEVQRLGTVPVEGDELRSRQALLTGSYARSMETNLGIARQIAGLVTYNLPLDTLDRFIPGVNKVTSDDITNFAKKYLGKPPAVIIAGQASVFDDALKDWDDLQVIPRSELDLNRTDLVKPR